MEERLDDAINVLRNHCEPQLNLPIPNLDSTNYNSGSQAPILQESNEMLPVKMERLVANVNSNSKFIIRTYV